MQFCRHKRAFACFMDHSGNLHYKLLNLQLICRIDTKEKAFCCFEMAQKFKIWVSFWIIRIWQMVYHLINTKAGFRHIALFCKPQKHRLSLSYMLLFTSVLQCLSTDQNCFYLCFTVDQLYLKRDDCCK